MSKSSKSSGNGLIILIVVILVLLIGAIAAFVVFGVVKGNQTTQEQQVGEVEPEEEDEQTAKDRFLERGIIENPEQVEEVVDDMKEKVEEGMFNCRMTMDWYFEDGTSVSPNAYVANSELNRYPFYFDVYVSKTGEKVYSSPVIPVGSYVNKITLDKDLSAGVYEMETVYTIVDEANDYEEVSSVSFAITVEIAN